MHNCDSCKYEQQKEIPCVCCYNDIGSENCYWEPKKEKQNLETIHLTTNAWTGGIMYYKLLTEKAYDLLNRYMNEDFTDDGLLDFKEEVKEFLDKFNRVESLNERSDRDVTRD
jgi:hypothetical protein